MTKWDRLGVALILVFLVALGAAYVLERGCYASGAIDYEYDPVPCR